MSYFTDAGYTKRTVFKSLHSVECFKKGELLVLPYDDDDSQLPMMKNSKEQYDWYYIPNAIVPVGGRQDTKVVSLDGVKDGLLGEDGNLLFHTNKEWKKHKKALKKQQSETDYLLSSESNKSRLLESVEQIKSGVGQQQSTKYKVGDTVQVIAQNNTERWFDLEEVKVVGTIISLGQGWEDSRMSDEKGYIVKLDGYIGLYDGNFIFHDKHLKLVEKVEDAQTKQTKLRTEDDYRNLTPDTMIEVVIDGHKAEVPLADILILKHVVGKCNGMYLDETYSLLKNFDSDMDGLNLGFISISGKIESYLKEYFNM